MSKQRVDPTMGFGMRRAGAFLSAVVLVVGAGAGAVDAAPEKGGGGSGGSAPPAITVAAADSVDPFVGPTDLADGSADGFSYRSSSGTPTRR